MMIILTVKTYDIRKEKTAEGAFDNAWFRLQNEDTNQSLDYVTIKGIDLPEGYVEEAAVEVEDEAEAAEPEERNELTYICGRVWLDQEPKEHAEKQKLLKERSQASLAAAEDEEKKDAGEMSGSDHKRSRASALANQPIEESRAGQWVYERFNMVTTSNAFPKLVQDLADLSKRVRDEETDQYTQMQDAHTHVKKAQEDRVLQEKLQAAKKKKPAKGKGAKDVEPDPVPVEREEKKEIKEEGPPNYHIHEQFLRHLKRKVPRPVTFGPIKFSDLHIEDNEAI
jgi:hypothetical protein